MSNDRRYWARQAKKFKSMDIKVVVPISGGKDSQTCLKLALQEYSTNQILGLFCDTQFEHPLTYVHIDNMETLYGVYIERVCEGSVEEMVRKYKRFPGGGARHCTDRLKIIPSKKFYGWLAQNLGRGFEVWYGMRSSESNQRKARYASIISSEVYPPHEVLGNYPKKLFTAGVVFRLPILDWTTDEVLKFLGGEANPLYARGFDRVGCFPCLAGGDASKMRAFSFDETGKKHLEISLALQEELYISLFRAKIGQAWEKDLGSGCSFCEI